MSGPVCCRLSAPSVRPLNGLPPALAVTAGCLRFLANPQNDTEQKVFSQTPRLFASAISIGLTASLARRLPFFEVFPLQSTWDMMSLSTPSFLPRKEVIQPHLPIRLPCYDFTPVTAPAFDRFDPGFGRERLPWCDGRCVQGPGTYSPQYADLRLLAIPTSYRRVAACNLNWDRF